MTAPVGEARPVGPAQSSPPSIPEHDFLLMDVKRRSVWVDILVVILCVVAAERLAMVSIFVAVASSDAEIGLSRVALERMLFFPVLSVRALAVIVMVAVVSRHRGLRATSVGLESTDLLANVLYGVGAVMVAYVLVFAWQAVMWVVWPNLLNQMTENADRIMSVIPKVNPAALGVIALVVAVYEEVFFRGFLMTRIRRATGGWAVAVLANTAIFTFLHSLDQTAAALVPITILSLVFSIVTIWRRSIIPAIVGHFVFDWGAFLVLYFVAGEAWT